jgi:hypothetical protein
MSTDGIGRAPLVAEKVRPTSFRGFLVSKQHHPHTSCTTTMADFCDTSSRTLSNESVKSEDSVYSDEDLTPEEINALLHRAADRIRSRELTAPQRNTTTFKLPKLDHSALPTPYIRTTGHVSVADQKALVPEATRSTMAKPRTVVDPVTEKAARVKGTYILFSPKFAMMK